MTMKPTTPVSTASPASTAMALGLAFPDSLVRTVAEQRLAEPQALFVDIYNVARAKFAPNLPIIASERYLPMGFAEAVQAELKKMVTPPPPPPAKPDPTIEELIGRIVSRYAAGGKHDDIMAAQQAIREHLRKLDLERLPNLEKLVRSLDAKGNDKAVEQRLGSVLKRVEALEERPTPAVQIDQVEARLVSRFNEFRTQLEETVMDLLAGEHPAPVVDVEPEVAEPSGKFKISICDPLVRKFAGRIAQAAPKNMRLYFENMDSVPPAAVGGRHFVVFSSRARKQWVDAFRATMPSERMIQTDRLGTTNLLKILEGLSHHPYFAI